MGRGRAALLQIVGRWAGFAAHPYYRDSRAGIASVAAGSAVLAAGQQVVPATASIRAAATYHKPLKLWQFFEVPRHGPGIAPLTATDSVSRGASVPHVASKASVLQSQHSGLTQRDRMAEAKDRRLAVFDPAGRGRRQRRRGPTPSGPVGASAHRNGTDAAAQPTCTRTDAERPQQTDEEHAADAAAQACGSANRGHRADATRPRSRFEIAAAGQAAATRRAGAAAG